MTSRMKRAIAGLVTAACVQGVWRPSEATAARLGDPAAPHVEAAEEHYERGDFGAALEQYRQALVEAPERPELRYNEGSVLYKLEKYGPALELLEQTAEVEDAGVASRSLYNAGNARFRQGDFAGAAESYTRALERAPDDGDARANLELALRRMEEQEQQSQEGEGENQDGQDGEPEPGEDGANPQGEDDPQPPDQEEPSPDQQSGDQQSPDPGDEPQQNPADEDQSETEETPEPESDPQDQYREGMTEEEAERLMEALADNDREAQRRRFRVLTPESQEKDW